jgi:hypothetical protein
MAYSEVYKCDREGCKSETRALTQYPNLENPKKYPYADDGWIRTTYIENEELVERDFCSIECLAVWSGDKLNEKVKG